MFLPVVFPPAELALFHSFIPWDCSFLLFDTQQTITMIAMMTT